MLFECEVGLNEMYKRLQDLSGSSKNLACNLKAKKDKLQENVSSLKEKLLVNYRHLEERVEKKIRESNERLEEQIEILKKGSSATSSNKAGRGGIKNETDPVTIQVRKFEAVIFDDTSCWESCLIKTTFDMMARWTAEEKATALVLVPRGEARDVSKHMKIEDQGCYEKVIQQVE